MKRLVVAIAIASVVLATAAPAFAVDPVKPAGNPVSTERSAEPTDSITAQVAQQVHATVTCWHSGDGSPEKSY